MQLSRAPIAGERRTEAGGPHLERPIYLDSMATTRLVPEAREAILPWLDACYGNASSGTHSYGWLAAEAVENAREAVAALLAVRPGRVFFTSGASEANNMVVKGVATAFGPERTHVITSAIEHQSVLEACNAIERMGARITRLPASRDGFVDPDRLRAALRSDTRLVSIMAANNEVGSIQPVAELGAITRGGGALFHVDAAQAVAKCDLELEAWGIDFLSISAHKLHGPQGVGALYAGPREPLGGLPALICGGGQERGRRSGTLPVALLAGFGAAARVATERWRTDAVAVQGMADLFWRELCVRIDRVDLNGPPNARLPGCLNFRISGVPADSLLAAAPELALSSASACISLHGERSHVLVALGLSPRCQAETVRLGISRFNTPVELQFAAELLATRAEFVRSRQAA
jgi:cysteine desulfurase